MGVKVYISGISGNKEVKKRQQRVLMILDSKNIEYSVIDITEPGRESDRDFMQEKSTSLGATVSDTSPRHALPPQLFNDDQYCGDYDQFDLANENDELENFLKVAPSDDNKVSSAELIMGNGTGEPAVESSEPQVDSTESVVTESIIKSNIKDTETDEVVSTETEVVDSSDMPLESGDGEKQDEEENEADAEEQEEEGA